MPGSHLHCDQLTRQFPFYVHQSGFCRGHLETNSVLSLVPHSLISSWSLRAEPVMMIERHSFTHQEPVADKDTQFDCRHIHPAAQVLIFVR